MAFLSSYNDTEKIDVGDGYWIEIKKCLSATEKQRAERAMATATLNLATGRDAMAKIDHVAYRNEMVVASVVAWNLDEEDGSIWALTPDAVKRANIGRLPGPVFDQVHDVIDGLNAPRSRDEQVRFPDAVVGGDPDGDRGSADDVAVLSAGEPVEAAGDAPGGPGVAALA